jgi:enamine deaminase RidA (YjgF/YER057c/UK114 family)
MTVHRTLLPPGWPRPRGYANGIAAKGTTIFTGGVVGWNEREQFAGPDLASQFRQVLLNTLAILKEAGAGPEHVVRMTWYVVDRDEYVRELPAIGGAYKELFGRNFPAMAVVQVSALVEPAARVEIETTAVLPD